MSHTLREFKGTLHPEKSHKNTGDRKRFVYNGEGWSTTAQGGPGNKRAWQHSRTPHRFIPKGQLQKYKDFPTIHE